MPVGAAIGGLGSIGSALIGSNAAQQASQQQIQASELAQQTENNLLQQTTKETAPFRQAGVGAVDQLSNIFGIPFASSNIGGVSMPGSAGGQSAINAAMANFTNTPNFQFAFDQGEQALDRSAAASGQLLSGGQLKAAQQFGQGLASQQFGNYFNQLLSLAGLGQTATGQQVGANTGVANSLAGLQTGAGTAAASGTVGSANALSGGLSSLGLFGALGTGALGTSGSASSFGGTGGGNPVSNLTQNLSLLGQSGGAQSGNGFSLGSLSI
ncbi:MAG: hypothetical protein WDN46_10410 [Methylocella sp.]